MNTSIDPNNAGAYLESLSRGAVHDINNVFALILSMSEIALLEPDLPSSTSSSLEKIIKYIERGRGITQSIYEYGNSFNHNKELVNFHIFMLKFENQIMGYLPADQKLKVISSSEVSSIRFDENLLNIAILNVCKNAIEALQESEVQSKNIFLTSQLIESGKVLEIKVEDTASGIADGIKKHVTLPFFTTRNRSKNAGMGLTIAQQVMLSHNGKLLVESASDHQGTIIRLLLPICCENT